MKFCDYCGKGYEPRQKRQRFCCHKCARKWWKEHPPVHSDPPDGATVLRAFECKLCRKEVKVVSTRATGHSSAVISTNGSTGNTTISDITRPNMDENRRA